MEIDGIAVEREETPASLPELSEVMKQSYDSGMAMIPVGGGTRLHLGNPPRSAHLAIRTSKLCGIVEYEPDNMTFSALAGTTLEGLQEVLRTKNQFLPLDPPHPDQSTIGGIVATNDSGPIRFRYGTVRDMLIGVKIVHPDGTPTKAGGKLVKNVTGYDMCKLYTGSLGTLGVLAELTFKIQPRPESLATVFLGYTSLSAALEATQLFLRAGLLPDAMEVWNAFALHALPLPLAATEVPWVLMIRFGEVEAAVRWQVEKLQELAPGSGAAILAVLPTTESEEFWKQAASARESSYSGEEALLKCSVLYQSTAETARLMEEMGQQLGARTSLYCHAGTYIIYGRYQWENGRPKPAEELRQAFYALRRHCVVAGGHAVVEKVRSEVKNGFDVWGYEAPALEIMRRIKQEFDPKTLLNPGRFVGGI